MKALRSPNLEVSSADVQVRAAALSDIPALLEIETRSFSTDRLSRRAFRHLLRRAHADCLAAVSTSTREPASAAAGYSVVLYRANSDVARLHSVAVDGAARGRGVGGALLEAAEGAAARRGAAKMRLAVRIDNRIAIGLYRSHGYTELGIELAYYTDGMSALRMEKLLAVA